ncbi:MAG: sporulation protein YunB [Clostridia bacterium]|nr:sporulation protein YunB [Clostridia bacterium]
MQSVGAKKIQKKRKLKAKTKFKIFCFCFLFVVALIAVYYFKVVCPIIVNLSKEKVYSIATSSVSDVVGSVLTKNQIEYADLVKISYSSSGDVETIEVDSVLVNQIIKQIANDLQQKFDNLSDLGIEIPTGAFTGIPFLYDVGPSTVVQLVAVGSAKTSLNSSFTSAGINQTLHKLNLVVSVNIGMVLPASTQTIATDIEVMICECLIVGKIPNIYLQGQLI